MKKKSGYIKYFEDRLHNRAEDLIYEHILDDSD